MVKTGWVAVALVALLAGCSAEGKGAAPKADVPSVGFEVGVGVLAGVVVDEAVRPIADADVTLTVGEEPRATTTDAQGVFRFDEVPPGTYVLEASHLLYKRTQVPVAVPEDKEVDPVRITLASNFLQTPYSLSLKFDGLINCGYEAVLISAPCITDYTSIVQQCAGGCVPELRQVQGDNRQYITEVNPGWTSLVIEMFWEPSASGTSEEMAMLLSYEKRTAQHWFASSEGKSPLRLEVEPDTAGAGAQVPSGDAETVPAEGRSDLLVLGSVRAGDNTGGLLGVAIQQKYTMIQHTFYHAAPPEGWSLLAGDEVPF